MKKNMSDSLKKPKPVPAKCLACEHLCLNYEDCMKLGADCEDESPCVTEGLTQGDCDECPEKKSSIFWRDYGGFMRARKRT